MEASRYAVKYGIKQRGAVQVFFVSPRNYWGVVPKRGCSREVRSVCRPI